MSVRLRDAGDVEICRFLCTNFKAGEIAATSLPFPIPMEIPAGYDIIVISEVANVTAHSFLHGFEGDA